MNATTKTTRFFFLDNIKVLFVLLVIFYHAAVTYGVTGWWYYIAALNEKNPTNELNSMFFMLLTIVGALFQASFMGLFFLLGGYLTPGSYERKGARTYWKSRLIRLGIPLVLYIVLLDPLMVYTLAYLGIKEWSTYSSLQDSFIDFYLTRFQSLNGIIDFLSSTGPMWFLTVLLLFTLGYTLGCQVAKQESLRKLLTREYNIPRISVLIIISLVLGFFTFIIRLFFPVGEVKLGIPIAFFIQYAMMFIVGVIAYRYDWFQKMDISQIKTWIAIILISAVFFVLYVLFTFGTDPELSDFEMLAGSFTLHALVYALVDNIICMGMIFVLIPIFRDKFNTQGNLAQKLSINAYNMYLIHALILVFVSLLMAPIQLLPVVKFVAVSVTTVVLCFLVSHFVLRKII